MTLLAVCVFALQTPAFRLDVEAVLVDVSVNHHGEPLVGLTASDFEVFDNGVRQQVQLVATESLPLSVLLVLDTSSSVAGEKLDHLRSAAHALLSGLEDKDQAALLTFSAQLQLRSGWTGDRGVLGRAVDGLEALGATGLNDALYAGLLMTESLRRPMIVLFTDGEDTFSWLSEAQVLRMAEESSAVIYAVGLAPGQEIRSGSRPQENPFLIEAAEITGGRLLYAAAAHELKTVFERILKEATTRYLLSYQPQGVPREGWHQLEVKLKRRRGEVRARRGYYFTSAAGSFSRPFESRERSNLQESGGLRPNTIRFAFGRSKRNQRPPIAIEWKWLADNFDPRGLGSFRRRYPKGPNFLVASDVDEAFSRRFGSLAVRFVSLAGLIEELAPKGRRKRVKRA